MDSYRKMNSDGELLRKVIQTPCRKETTKTDLYMTKSFSPGLEQLNERKVRVILWGLSCGEALSKGYEDKKKP